MKAGLAALCAAASVAANAACPAQSAYGSGRLTWFGLAVYDAALCADARFSPRNFEQQPFALELTYLRALKSADIASRSVEEMRRAGGFDAPTAQRWEAALRALLPDVRENDRITGVNLPGEGAAFYVNGRWAGEVRDAEFARLFFAIWLAPTTSEPALRDQLLRGPAR